MRAECNLHCGTPYPPAASLWQYPMSIWPLRAFSGFLDDRINAPAHCAALSARILRSAFPRSALPQPSHWYGPSSLYLELSTPERMERALALQRPVVRSQWRRSATSSSPTPLRCYSDDEVIGMAAATRDRRCRPFRSRCCVPVAGEGRTVPRPGHVSRGTGAPCAGGHAVHVAQSQGEWEVTLAPACLRAVRVCMRVWV